MGWTYWRMMLFLYSVRNEIQHRNEIDSILNFQDRINKAWTGCASIQSNTARNNILRILSLGQWKQVFIPKLEVVSLRTSKKTLPGRKLAIYIGCVIAILILSYNLTKNLSFILVSHKEGVFNSISNEWSNRSIAINYNSLSAL